MGIILKCYWACISGKVLGLLNKSLNFLIVIKIAPQKIPRYETVHKHKAF